VELVFVIAVAVAVWAAWYSIRRARRPGFWRIAARYPDQAYDWFTTHDCWVVADPESGAMQRPDDAEFAGPYILRVPKLGGRRVAVYGRRDEMKESQDAFLAFRGLRDASYI
jgi:hypothetical protein